MKNKDLTIGNESKVILAFSIPLLLGNLFQQIYNLSDSIIVGRLLGKQALASVGFYFQINLLIIAISMGISIGFSILTSKYFGSKNFRNIEKLFSTSFIFSLLLSLTIVLLLLFFQKNIFKILNIPSQIYKLTQLYYQVMLLGIIPIFLYNAVSGILRGIGDSKGPMIFLIASTLLNILLDLIFILNLNMGVKGAAFATVISQLFSLLGSYIYIIKFYPNLNLKLYDFDTNILKYSLKIGIPATMQYLFACLGMIVIQVLINGYGTTYMAAFIIASRIDALAQMPILNLGNALSNFISQNIGAKKTDRIKNGFYSTVKSGSVISITISMLILLNKYTIVSMFTKDTEVINVAINYLKIVSGFYILFAIMQITNGVLIGYRKSLIPMISTIVSLCLIQVPISIYLSSTKLKFLGICIAVPIGWFFGFLIRFIYYYKNIFKNNYLDISSENTISNEHSA